MRAEPKNAAAFWASCQVQSADLPSDLLEAGRFAGAYGVRGWVRLVSFTDEHDVSLFDLGDWYVQHARAWYQVNVAEARPQGSAYVARFATIADRDHAQSLKGAKIFVTRAALPAPERDEFYWADLIGLAVRNIDGVDFGKVKNLLETGANDVMVVQGERERLIPFVRGDVITRIDTGAGLIEVDWHEDD